MLPLVAVNLNALTLAELSILYMYIYIWLYYLCASHIPPFPSLSTSISSLLLLLPLPQSFLHLLLFLSFLLAPHSLKAFSISSFTGTALMEQRSLPSHYVYLYTAGYMQPSVIILCIQQSGNKYVYYVSIIIIIIYLTSNAAICTYDVYFPIQGDFCIPSHIMYRMKVGV